MKQLFKQINKINKQIERTQNRIKDIKTMPYYSIYGSETERTKDLKTCNEYLRDCLNQKHTLVENLMLECNKELGRVAMQEHQQVVDNLKTA